MERKKNDYLVLDIGYSKIKAVFSRSAAPSQKATSFIELQGATEKIEGLTKRGIQNKNLFSHAIEKVLSTFSEVSLENLNTVSVLYSSPSNIFVKETISRTLRKDSGGIFITEEWLSKRMGIICSKLQKKHLHKTCTYIKPISILADGEDIIYDYEGYHANSSIEITFACVLTPTPFLEALEESVERVVNIERFSPMLAAIDLLVTEEQKENGIIVCDVGRKFSEVFMYKEGFIHNSFILPIGGDDVTKEIALRKKLSMKEAEKLKLNLHKNESSIKKQEVQSVNKVLLAILKEKLIPRIEEEGEKTTFAEGILLTGGGALYPSMIKIFSDATKLHTFSLPPNPEIQTHPTVSPYFFQLGFAFLRRLEEYEIEPTLSHQKLSTFSPAVLLKKLFTGIKKIFT